MLDKNIKKYLKHIRTLLPMYSRQEKRFLNDLKTSIEKHISENPDTSLEDITAKFGTPNDVVYDYIESVDFEYIMKRLSTRKTIKRVAAIILILAIVLFFIFAGSIYLSYLDSKNTVITHELVVIE